MSKNITVSNDRLYDLTLYIANLIAENERLRELVRDAVPHVESFKYEIGPSFAEYVNVQDWLKRAALEGKDDR